jgi:hypothetical protein
LPKDGFQPVTPGPIKTLQGKVPGRSITPLLFLNSGLSRDPLNLNRLRSHSSGFDSAGSPSPCIALLQPLSHMVSAT